MENSRKYVGQRYVPKIMGEWSKSETYEGLSIVTYQGASYTSKKRVPVGIDISNEEFWVVTGNYNAQIEEYRNDVKHINNKISFLDNFYYVDTNGSINDLKNLNDTINKAYENGGGTVKLSSKKYFIDDTIIVKENVLIEGDYGTELIYQKSFGNVLIFEHKSGVRNLSIVIDNENYNDVALLFSNVYLNNNNRKDKSTSCRCTIQNIKLYGPFSVSNVDNTATAFKLFSTQNENLLSDGFYGLNAENIFIKGFKTCFDFETQSYGWINGNIFTNINAIEIKHFIKTTKSSESKGIDWNEFDKIQIQPTSRTGQLFDDKNGKNLYNDLKIWDLHKFTNASMGYANNLKNIFEANVNVKSLLTRSLVKNKFSYIGSFLKNSDFYEINLSLFGRKQNYDLVITLTGANNGILKDNGLRTVNEDFIEFYTREKNGLIEVYFKTIEDNTLNLFLESYIGFTPSPVIRYDEVENLTKVEMKFIGKEENISENVYKLNNGMLLLTGDDVTVETETVSSEDNKVVKKAVSKILFNEPYKTPPTVTGTSTTFEKNYNIVIRKEDVDETGFTPHFITDMNNLESNNFYMNWQSIGIWG